jgi:hypothetical protein
MVDRFLVWLGAGAVTVGVSAALVAGAGVAMATDGDSSDGGGTKTSESSDSPGSNGDSGAQNTSPGAPNVKDDDVKGDDPGPGNGTIKDAIKNAIKDALDGTNVDEATDEDLTDFTDIGETTDGDLIDEDSTGTDGEAGELGEEAQPTETGTASHKKGVQAGNAQIAQWTQAVVDRFGPAAKTPDATSDANLEIKEDPATGSEPEAVEQHAFVNVVNLFEDAKEKTEAPEVASVAFATPAAAQVNAMAFASPLTVVLDIIGTIVFGLYSLVTQTVGGPPVIPPRSTVTVLTSRLRIDCGCAPGEGSTVPVNWYIPEVAEGDPPPERLIYLQHGFLASAPWYSYTANALAEQTNSIVVAPSITSNFLAADQCWLGGAPMHEAMAALFDEDNTALADSAARAGYDGPIPDRVVLMGHSLGGGAVSGIAGYMTDRGTDDRLAGVILLDGVGLNGEMANDLKKVDLDIPIYQLAAPKYFWNQFGIGTDALIEARPDADFYGVTLVGGSHVDTMRGGNWLIQFSQQVVSGFSKPANVAAARTLMVGWTNDMFTGAQGDERVGIYLDGRERLTINTPGGKATLVNLPNPLSKLFILNILRPLTSLTSSIFSFGPSSVAASIGTAADRTDSIAA